LINWVLKWNICKIYGNTTFFLFKIKSVQLIFLCQIWACWLVLFLEPYRICFQASSLLNLSYLRAFSLWVFISHKLHWDLISIPPRSIFYRLFCTEGLSWKWTILNYVIVFAWEKSRVCKTERKENNKVMKRNEKKITRSWNETERNKILVKLN
jgi:hypothetical protein